MQRRHISPLLRDECISDFFFFLPVSSPTGGTRAIRRLPSANNGNDERFDKNRSTVAVQSAPINGHLGDTSMIYFDFGDRNDSE